MRGSAPGLGGTAMNLCMALSGFLYRSRLLSGVKRIVRVDSRCETDLLCPDAMVSLNTRRHARKSRSPSYLEPRLQNSDIH